jgi:hypothetical protein
VTTPWRLSESKPCERCGKPSSEGFRFCQQCVKDIRKAMKDEGYLEREPYRPYRSNEKKENRYETKNGVDE